jgi:HK97 family phage major capsid protein
LRLFKRVNMSSATDKMPVLAALPTAYWRDGDTGLIQTSEVEWGNKMLTAEEVSVIVPVPKTVLADASFDIWAEVRPMLTEALGRALDSAVFFGTNKPSSWPSDIVTLATAASNTAVIGDNATAALGGIAEDINDAMATVEADGFDVNGMFTNRAFRTRFRSARDSTGQRYLDIQAGGESYDGIPVASGSEGDWPTAVSTARLILGDFSKGIVGVRSDINFEMSDQGVIQDAAGNIRYNLLQQRMMAMIVTARFAFQVANPLTRNQATEGSRCPFGVLKAAAS